MISNLLLSRHQTTATTRVLRSFFAMPALWMALVLLACALPMRSGHAEVIIDVSIDEAKVVSLPDKTSTVVIGNPIVADVTILKQNNAMVLTGKGFGQTNLIALDAQGNSLGESIVRVQQGPGSLIVQRGMDRQSYSCSSRCQPSVALGDDSKYMSQVLGQISTRNGAAQPGAAVAAGHN